jgi:hypothetical protein
MLRIADKGKKSPGQWPGLVDGLFQTASEKRVR